MRKALIVGINYYSQIRGLYGCANDARAVKKALERNGDGTVNFAVNLVTAESDADAISRDSVKDLVRDLFAEDHEVALYVLRRPRPCGTDRRLSVQQRMPPGRRRPLAR